MTSTEILTAIRQQLAQAQPATLAQTKVLLAIIDELEAERECKRAEEALREAERHALILDERLLARLTRLTQAVGTARDLTTVFRALLDFVIMAAPTNGLFASLYDPDLQERTCVFAWSEGQEIDVSALPSMPMSNSPHSRAVATGQIIVTNDLEAALAGQPRFDLAFDTDPRPPRSSIAVPMLVMGQVIGGFEVQSVEAAAYSEEHVTAMRMAANLAAIAIENMRLLERERQLRLAAQASEERFRATFNQAAVGIAHGGMDGKWLLVNQRLCDIVGYTQAEMLERTFYDITHPDDLDADLEYTCQILADEIQSYSMEKRYKRKDGSIVWVNLTVSLVRAPSGAPKYFISVVEDISERKRAEEAQRFLTEAGRVLATSLDYETTLQNVAHLAVPFLADGCFVGLLEADQSVRGLATAHVDPAKEQFLRELHDRYPLGRQQGHLIQQVLQTGQPELIPDLSNTRWATIGPEAEQRSLLHALSFKSAMIVPLAARGRTLGVIVFATADSGRHYGSADLALAEDLAGRAALAVENAQLYRDAQQALVARDDFISFAAHELRGPLIPIAAATELLQRWLPTTQREHAREQRALQVLTEATQLLNELINMVSDLAGIQSGRFSLMCQPVDLVQLTQHVVRDVRQPPTHTLQLMSSEESLVIEGDELRLARVLHNLLQNAIKYSPAGGPILVQLGREADQATIAVIDHGIGIPPAALVHLFERFYRASNVDPLKTSGFGVGLYLVKEIVTRHGGRVEVSSVEGQGSTFTVRLPLAAPAP